MDWFKRLYPPTKGAPLSSQPVEEVDEISSASSIADTDDPITCLLPLKHKPKTPDRRIVVTSQVTVVPCEKVSLANEVPTSVDDDDDEVLLTQPQESANVACAERVAQEDPLAASDEDPFPDENITIEESMRRNGIAFTSDDREEDEEEELESEEEEEEEEINEDEKAITGLCAALIAYLLDRKERAKVAAANNLKLPSIKEEFAAEYKSIFEAFQTETTSQPKPWNCRNPQACGLSCLADKTIVDMCAIEEEDLCKILKDHGLMWSHEFCDHTDDEKVKAMVKRKTGEPLIRKGKIIRNTTCPIPGCVSRGCHPQGPLGQSNDTRNQKGLCSRLIFLRMYCAGLRHCDMKPFGLKMSKNGLTMIHNQVDKLLAAAHMLYNEAAVNKYKYVEVDEFFIGGSKNGKGEQRVEQLCFQSLIAKESQGPEAKVIAFHVRYVPTREQENLTPWIINMLAEESYVEADGALSYKNIVERAMTLQKKTVHFSTVDHKYRFKSDDGTCTNRVEGMHMHVRRFLRQFHRIGNDKYDRINRVCAAAHLAVPKRAENPNGPPSTSEKFGKCLRAIQKVAMECLPIELIFKRHFTNFTAQPLEPVRRLIPAEGKMDGDNIKSPVRDGTSKKLFAIGKKEKTSRELFADADREAKKKKSRSEIVVLGKEVKKQERADKKLKKMELENAEAISKMEAKVAKAKQDLLKLKGRGEGLKSKRERVKASITSSKEERKVKLSQQLSQNSSKKK